MAATESFAPELGALIGQKVVVDTKGVFLYVGTLRQVNANTLLLTEVDVHNCAQSPTPNDLYLIQLRTDGIRINRQSVHVLAKEVVSVSLLSDIVMY